MKLPNGVSVIILVALYGALEAVAAQLSLEAGWLPEVATILAAALAKAIQVYIQASKETSRWSLDRSQRRSLLVKRFFLE